MYTRYYLTHFPSNLVYHVNETGWTFHGNHDVGALHYEYEDLKARESQIAV